MNKTETNTCVSLEVKLNHCHTKTQLTLHTYKCHKTYEVAKATVSEASMTIEGVKNVRTSNGCLSYSCLVIAIAAVSYYVIRQYDSKKALWIRVITSIEIH